MNIWEYIGLSSKRKMEEQHNVIVNLIQDIKEQQYSILNLIQSENKKMYEYIFNNNEKSEKIILDLSTLINDSTEKKEELKEILCQLKTVSEQADSLIKSDFTGNLKKLKKTNVDVFTEMNTLIKGLNSNINILDTESIQPMLKNISIIQEIFRFILINNLMDDVESNMKKFKKEKRDSLTLNKVLG